MTIGLNSEESKAVAKPRLARTAWVALLLASLVSMFWGCTMQEYPQTTLSPHSDYARRIQSLLEQQVFWVVLIFVGVLGALLFAAIRFRSRPGTPDPKPVHGNTVLEVAWTIAPAVILALVAIPTVLTIYATQGKAPPGALRVTVVGHQWWWEFKYPDLGITTASELHVPVNVPVAVDIETADVLHSFWFPAVGGKRDAVPNHTNHMWFTADSVGEFMGQCAELCGLSHANMRMRLHVDTPGGFDAWVSGQKAPPSFPDSASAQLAWQGEQNFKQGLCVACHTIDGISAGVVGPNLTHFATRTTIAGSTYPSNTENLGRWLADAPSRKPGSLMPNQALKPDQVAALVAFLQGLK
jgi:cytochrome c oxidase subunit II